MQIKSPIVECKTVMQSRGPQRKTTIPHFRKEKNSRESLIAQWLVGSLLGTIQLLAPQAHER